MTAAAMICFTADGLTDLPALSPTSMPAWHNYFEGDLGGLKVPVRSSDLLDIDDNDAAVIIGGSRDFVAQPDAAAVVTPCIQGIVNSRCRRTRRCRSTPAATVTAVPPTAVPATSPAPCPRPGGGAAGVISAPDTGTARAVSVEAGTASCCLAGLLRRTHGIGCRVWPQAPLGAWLRT
jgi:hypothetical protein